MSVNNATLATMKGVDVLGMPLDEWIFKSCKAHFATGKDWATLYAIKSSEPGHGHATQLLTEAKEHYGQQGKKVGGTVALTPVMKHLYKKLSIPEYT